MTLESFGVAEGVALNMVRSAPPRAAAAAPPVAAAGPPRAIPGGSSRLDAASMGAVQEQLAQNPEMAQEVFDLLGQQYPEFATAEGHAALQEIFNDPEALAQLLSASGVDEDDDANDGLAHVFSSDELSDGIDSVFSALSLSPSTDVHMEPGVFMQGFVSAINALAESFQHGMGGVPPTPGSAGTAQQPARQQQARSPAAPARVYITREHLAECMENVMRNVR
ncbi:hypothetical protein SARC_06689 [Sphaeroforma arctica JP610]|uniref:Uncharacterized protein n=1 Tax=Sphaeroforma arctica JP610 TaxID=667725 RepID=A0A0L0FVU3_9EUKA|nr:hypothetical protein SARC_06689 [Sphaeroforma arctica JP610]KNC80957.1 hypothetical protein SARC_06689 [Sphaeroforma arctica JP610]|eukprot:XP_014154859.1 hypothetical protein SARC_06689 [Sphaeroforma arctica JP610]